MTQARAACPALPCAALRAGTLTTFAMITMSRSLPMAPMPLVSRVIPAATSLSRRSPRENAGRFNGKCVKLPLFQQKIDELCGVIGHGEATPVRLYANECLVARYVRTAICSSNDGRNIPHFIFHHGNRENDGEIAPGECVFV
jgi:hypothetical protein